MKPKFITVDIESEGLNPFKDKLVFIGYRVNGIGERIVVNSDRGEFSEELNGYLSDPDIDTRGQNIKFDCLFLAVNGYTVVGPLDCTRILAYLTNPLRSLDLESLVKSELGESHIGFKEIYVKPNKREEGKEYVKIDKKYVLRSDLVRKNEEDVLLCDDLRKTQFSNDWYKKVEQPLISTIYDMELLGIKTDQKYLKELDDKYTSELSGLEDRIGLEKATSTQQVEKKLIEMGLPLRQFSVKGKNGHYSTGKLILKYLSWSLPKGKDKSYLDLILRHREISKLKNTYINRLRTDIDENDRVHGQFNQAGSVSRDEGGTGTKTGRLSSSEPALQCIPVRTDEGKKIRKVFIPSTGDIMFDSDLKQIEPRVLAHYTQSPKLLKAYNEGEDTHMIFACDIFNKREEQVVPMERFIGKTCWLATVYRCGAKKLKYSVDKDSVEPVPHDVDFYKDVQDSFWAANPEIKEWSERLLEETRKTGYIVTYSGRVVKIPNINARGKWGMDGRYAAERKAINYKIQGSAADIMKLIMLRMDREFKEQGFAHLLAVVHDELLGEYTPVETNRYGWTEKDMRNCIDEIMTGTCKLNNVPIDCDTYIVKNWGEAK